MKGPQLLALLLLISTGTGVFLFFRQSSSIPYATPTDDWPESVTTFLANESPFGPTPPPPTSKVSGDRLFHIVSEHLHRIYGDDGLTRRMQAFELLHLLPPAQNLQEQWLIAHLAGAPGWFDETSGTLFLHEDFEPNSASDRATLVRLSTLWALHKQDPPALHSLSDDQHSARRAIHGGIASAIEARYHSRHKEPLSLPTSAETEREATLLSLPLYIHNLVQLPIMEGKDFVEAHRNKGHSWSDILEASPDHTLALLDPQATPHPPLSLPSLPSILLQESLGAYATQLLCERLSDHLQAESLGPAWRGDRYALFEKNEGTHLLWISHWATPEAARQMAVLLGKGRLYSSPHTPQLRHERMMLDGSALHYLNCADTSTLDEFLPPELLSEPTSPHHFSP